MQIRSLFLIVLFGAIGVAAQPSFRLIQNYYTGLSLPVFLTNAGDGTRRIFIVEQRGTIKMAKPGSSVLTTYLNISGTVSSSGNERGLLGLAFHPQFAQNRRFFVYYTRQTDGAVEIAEYQQNAANPNIADPTPVRTIITIAHSSFSNHNGGTVAFGPDGYLYAAPGDGGSGNDPNANAQNINVLLGKMLRLDIDTPVGQVPAYNIPPTNPFAGATPGADEIFAYGLRNPYRFSFDRGGTHTLWVGDVGQDAIEEVDNVTLGGNYGWRVYEGTRCTGNDPQLCAGGSNPITWIPPILEYSSAAPDPRCSVTGGYIYRGRQHALPEGAYVFADYCTGEIFRWYNGQMTTLLDTSRQISGFGQDEDGELYVVGLGGTVDKIAGSRVNGDFDGDGGTDIAVFRTSNGAWYSVNPTSGASKGQLWGFGTDIPVADDYDGDGKADHAVFRPGDGTWYMLRSSDGTFSQLTWGLSTDVPVPGDFDGDGKADITVYRPSSGHWITYRSSDGGFVATPWGAPEDQPVNGDYDGDGIDDLAVFRPSTGAWYVLNSSNGQLFSILFGQPEDKPVPGDYDGDGQLDVAVFRPSNGGWYIRKPSGEVTGITWGFGTDIPVPGDYDRDGRDDVAIFRPSDGSWWYTKSSDGSYGSYFWGQAGDTPIVLNDRP